MKKIKNEDSLESKKEGKTYYCSVCGREISREDYEDYDGMCWE